MVLEYLIANPVQIKVSNITIIEYQNIAQKEIVQWQVYHY